MKVYTSGYLDEQIAQRFFGWKWVSYMGIPIKGTPDYPQKMRVRMFLSPKQQAADNWEEWCKKREARDADGTEPLAYDYCSSHSYVVPVPHYSGDWNAAKELDREIERRGLTEQYKREIYKIVGIVSECNHTCEMLCAAALELPTGDN